MAKLFLFGIGGSGARVVRSLTIMLSAGINLPNVNTLVPILIDPDASNGDLNRTTSLLNRYQDIQQKLRRNKGFFSQEIKTLSAVSDNSQLKDVFTLSLLGSQNRSFEEFIQYQSMSQENKDMVDLLFSEQNKDLNMNVGFKGNPNIGSVVLNQFKDSPEFKQFINTFKDGDFIFIISSIFGGTGAAGFPLLVKNIRELEGSAATIQSIRDSKIGALSLLPYFDLEDGEKNDSEIESNTFLQKTKSALRYYKSNLTGTNTINCFYYLGDKANVQYENFDGQINQKNKAHIIELSAALAVVNFCNGIDKYSSTNGVANGGTSFMEFGIRNFNNNIDLNDLGKDTNRMITLPIIKMYLFNLFLKDGLSLSKKFKVRWIHDMGMEFLSDRFFTKDLSDFINDFEMWIKELETNKDSFKPFDSYSGPKKAFEILNGIEPDKGFLDLKSTHLNNIDRQANRLCRQKVVKWGDESNKAHAFIEMMDISIEKAIQKLYPQLS